MKPRDVGRLTKEEVDALLSYDPETGIVRWRVDRLWGRNGDKVRMVAGSEAGSVDIKTGYRRIKIEGRSYIASRLAVLIMTGHWPLDRVDHRRRADRDDNRWENLRESTHGQNIHNRTEQKNNTSGMRGVNFIKHIEKWQTRIGIKGKRFAIGYYDTYDEAVSARLVAEQRFYGEFAPM